MEKTQNTEPVTKRTRGRPRKDSVQTMSLDVQPEPPVEEQMPTPPPVEEPQTPLPKQRKQRTEKQLAADARNRERMLAMHRERMQTQRPSKPTLKRSTKIEHDPESEVSELSDEESESDESVHIIRKPRESRKPVDPRQRKPKRVVYISESEDYSDSADDSVPNRSSFYFA